jgi:hypothetical protein
VRGDPGGKRETRRFETPILRAAERAQAEGRELQAWVREGWQAWEDFDDKPPRDIPRDAVVLYMADRPRSLWDSCRRAPFHMPRWASRLTLLDVTIRRERLGDISEASALAEGIIPYQGERKTGLSRFVKPYLCPVTGDPRHETARDAYISLWDHLHGESAFAENEDREIMVITFRPVLANIDGIGPEHE